MENQVKHKILYVSPHLSTGGLPQYLLKKIEKFNSVADVYCVEYSFLGWDFVVQRNQISNLLGSKFFSLDSDKKKLIDIISSIQPDILHFEEISETFVDESLLREIYNPQRSYLICESCHSSTFDPISKIYKPDKFLMVNKWIQKKFKVLDIPSEILEYPVEIRGCNKKSSIELLGLDPSKKHVVNVGLFTPGKNQGEIFEYAKALENLPIEFHFVGNQAQNFSDYWEPLMKTIPKNCRIWGERTDVENFYQAVDLFLFTSKLELNPLVIKEALSYNLPSIFYDLETYSGEYSAHSLVKFLTTDKSKNVELILEFLGFEKK